MGLYACGMNQRDFTDQIKSLYGVEISPELVSRISGKIMPELTAWQNRPLEQVYPFVFMDAIHYKVKENHQYLTKAAHVVLGIRMDGGKDIFRRMISFAAANYTQKATPRRGYLHRKSPRCHLLKNCNAQITV